MTQQAPAIGLARALTAVIFTGPDLPEGKAWCQPGIMFWKKAALDYYASQGVLDKEFNPVPGIKGNNEDETVLTLPLDIGQVPGLCFAQMKALSAPLMMLGPVDICWNHLSPLMLQRTSQLAQAGPGQVPGIG